MFNRFLECLDILLGNQDITVKTFTINPRHGGVVYVKRLCSRKWVPMVYDDKLDSKFELHEPVDSKEEALIIALDISQDW
jgi:hypothetical protein